MARPRTDVVVSLAVALVAAWVLGASPAAAAGRATTRTVTTTADLPAPCSASAVSLRCAILAANRAGSGVTIAFDIPASASGCAGTPTVCTISPATAFPVLTATDTVIDGYTEPGTAPNDLPLAQGDDARIGVRVDGSLAPAGTSGLVVGGDRDTVRGLSITGFIVCFDCGPIPGEETGGSAIELRAASDVVAGNFLGVLPDGVTAGPNQFAGVDVTGSGAESDLIGGTDPASTNVLSGNEQCSLGDCQGFGAYVDVTGTGTTVRGNLIGTTASGHAALGNAATALVVLAPKAIVAQNVVSGSGGDAVLTGGTGIKLTNNLIGTDATGHDGLENHSHGVDVQADANVLRGNVISDSGDTGLVVSGTNTIVQGNKIGTDVTGRMPLGNGFDPSAIFLGQPINGTDGIVLCAGGNTIGGTSAGQGNLVSANRGDGIFVGSGDNVVQGNRVGTDASGRTALGNHVDGIGSRPRIFQGVGFCQQAPNGGGAANNTIGGTAAGAGNLVSANRQGGIDLVGAANDTVANNRVGTDAGGTAPLGNSGDGVALGPACNEHGCTPSTGDRVSTNLIGANTLAGIDVVGTGGGTGIVVTGNGVGVDTSGNATLGNAGAGVSLSASASGDVVGGTVPSDANLIAGNGGPGILVGASASDTGTHVLIEGNSTFGNAGLGIDLAPRGAVDCSTPPPGPNDYVPCPAITSASTATVSGTACPGCIVELFVAQAGADDAGHGEGARFLARTFAAGNGAWAVAVPSGMLASGDQVTATATTPSSTTPSETSEFGANRSVA
jgi:hypothetical protein